MPRPKRERKMNLPPDMLGFKPFGTPLRDLEAVELLFEEFESIKLADYQDLTQEEAAIKMCVSRPTFTRIYDKARKTVALALAESKVIVISGGNVKFDKNWFKCRKCDQTFVSPPSRKSNCGHCDSEDIMKVGESNLNKINELYCEDKSCYCEDCRIEVSHKQGVPCHTVKCPYCNKNMVAMSKKSE